LNCSIRGTEAALATRPTAWQPSKNRVQTTLSSPARPGVEGRGGVATVQRPELSTTEKGRLPEDVAVDPTAMQLSGAGQATEVRAVVLEPAMAGTGTSVQPWVLLASSSSGDVVWPTVFDPTAVHKGGTVAVKHDTPSRALLVGTAAAVLTMAHEAPLKTADTAPESPPFTFSSTPTAKQPSGDQHDTDKSSATCLGRRGTATALQVEPRRTSEKGRAVSEPMPVYPTATQVGGFAPRPVAAVVHDTDWSPALVLPGGWAATSWCQVPPVKE
jgi:hypothetical protein